MKKKTIKILFVCAPIALAVIFISALVYALYFKPYYPQAIVEGENPCRLGGYHLTKDGLQGFKEIINRSENMRDIYTVAYFEANISRNGTVISFTLSLDTFDENNQYSGLALYTYSDKKLIYNPPEATASQLVHQYNPNSAIDYLDREIRKIPLKEQLKVSGLHRYVVRYQPYTVIESGTPIFDGRQGGAFPALNRADYNAGKGGKSDGKTNVVFRLYDGQSIAVGQQYLYVCKPSDPSLAIGNRLSMMENDYFINNGTLKFTRNYGADSIDTDITKEELRSTLEFYGNKLALPPQSVFISSDQSLPIAYFYGGNPVLSISSDNGKTWKQTAFPKASDFGRSIQKRAVGFVSSEFGYAAIGTDWSMGGGENKMCYFTFDKGQSWQEKPLPLQGTSHTLNDMAMADEQTGAVALDKGTGEYFPIIYVTDDTGDSWTEIKPPFEALPKEIQFLSDIERFTVSDGVYTLTLGQSDSGTIKAVFTAADLTGTWEFSEFYKSTIHTAG